MESARQRRQWALWVYVIMPEHIHIMVCPKEPVYEVRLIRTALKVPVQRQALAFLRHHAPGFLGQLRDEQPKGEVHYRFWQRGGGYDRNITEATTLRLVVNYLHENPVRCGLYHPPRLRYIPARGASKAHLRDGWATFPR
jgi:putative transposase